MVEDESVKKPLRAKCSRLLDSFPSVGNPGRDRAI
jgi:hypothetical protein